MVVRGQCTSISMRAGTECGVIGASHHYIPASIAVRQSSTFTMAAPPPPPPTATVTAGKVLTYVPNLIGYARIFLVSASFVLLIAGPKEWWDVAVLLYVGGFVGDLFDGYAARALGQTSCFGGVLDMVTDRCSTVGLLYVLGHEYASVVDDGTSIPSATSSFRLGFLVLQILDVASHWCQMYATLSLGLHHKSEEGNADKNVLVRWFYRYYWFFGYLCCGAEFTYVLLLVRSRTLDSKGLLNLLSAENTVRLVDFALVVTVPGCLAKQAVNVTQLSSACYAIADADAAAKSRQACGKAD
jgi:CDP-diacylglycerol--inositol 3-phosphatidyltransferase